MSKGIFFFIILVISTVFVKSCYEPVEGCRDVKATNYDVTADINCCCEYPRLIFNYSYLYDTLDYSQSIIFTDVNGAPFMIDGFQLGLNKVKIIDENGDTTMYSDTLEVDQSDLITSKFFSFLHSSTSSRIGLIDTDQDYVSLSFTTGLPNEVRSYERNELMQNTSFINATENLYFDNKWHDGYVRYVPDTAQMDSTITVRIDVNEIDLKFDRDFVTEIVRDLRIGFTIDLNQVFNDFNVKGSREMQREQLSEDWKAAISIDSL